MIECENLMPVDLRCKAGGGSVLSETVIEAAIISLQNGVNVNFHFNGEEYTVRYADLMNNVQKVVPETS